jgi:hypothetical protein
MQDVRHAVAQLVEALRYTPEGRGFINKSFRPHYGPGVEYQEDIPGIRPQGVQAAGV